MDRLKNKVALITGAAVGMGAAHAKLFVKEGAKVIITDLNEEKGKALESELGIKNALFIKHDVSKWLEWTRVVEQAENKFGPVNVLVNNAGISMQDTVETFTEEAYKNIVEINQCSVAFGMKAVISSMRKGEAGSIINTSSIAGIIGEVNTFSYVGTKFAIRGMTKAAALHLAQYNIRVNSVHPGVIETTMLDAVPEEVIDQLRDEIPLKRIGKPSDISALVLFLASDESSFSTGSEFVADGGAIAG